jgi:lysophospholipase L1-like esterase
MANNYLALGDSVSFGFNPLLEQPGVSADVFVGFPHLASEQFVPPKDLVNASCPGETSTSLITGSKRDGTCRDYRHRIGALHVAYSGSQLSFAKRYLAANPRTGLVTVMIGANDLFQLIDTCGGSTDPTCVESGLPRVVSMSRVNATITSVTYAFGGQVADGFGKFGKAVSHFGGDPCRAGLLIQNSDGTCDIHPSRLGADLLADAVIDVSSASTNHEIGR